MYQWVFSLFWAVPMLIGLIGGIIKRDAEFGAWLFARVMLVVFGIALGLVTCGIGFLMLAALNTSTARPPRQF
ncbi:hypothetical protein ACIGO9_30860 [Nocardia asteroides]|uniref:hypothetical protein n=1 Tax=Nocardia asteroides TaxID=1824 RepID=UPI0037C891A9